MEEIYKQFGLPGVFALATALVILFWRIKLPQISLDYLQRELEVSRGEMAQSDKDRSALRLEIAAAKVKIAELDTDYIACLADREKCRRHIRDLERQVKDLGGKAVAGDEDRP